MNVLTDIVRNVVALVLIFSCLTLFIPKGELSKFIHLGFGLIVLAMIIIPASEALQNMRFSNPLSNMTSEVNADYSERTEQITMILEQEAMTEYENDAARQIGAAAFLAEGVNSAKALVETDRSTGAILRVEINAAISPAYDLALAEENIRSAIAKYFIIDDANIYIQLREDI